MPTFSIHIPYWKTIHFAEGRKVGESRPACYKGLAHYDWRGRPTGKSIRNFVGELNHYDCRDNCTGYSRRTGFCQTNHYNSRGEYVGLSISIANVVSLHKWKKWSREVSHQNVSETSHNYFVVLSVRFTYCSAVIEINVPYFLSCKLVASSHAL